MQLTWRNSADDISAADWNRCFLNNVEGRWWYQALERSGLSDQFTFLYAIVQSNGVVICVAPVFVMDVPIDMVAPPFIAKLLRGAGAVIRRLRYQRTLFIGSPCADEGTVGIAPGCSMEELFQLIHDACTQRAAEARASIVVWKDFPPDSHRALDQLASKRQLFRVVSYPGTRVAITNSFDGYLAALSSSHRHNLRKKLRKGESAGKLDSSVVQQPSPDVLKEIFALFWQTYERGSTKFERLTPAFFDQIAALDHSYFVLLRHPADNKLAAFMLCFRLGDRVINKFIGLDYTLGDGWFLYFRLWEAAVRWATSPGIAAKEIQSGQTGYRAKLDVGHTLVPLLNYCRHRNGLMNRLFARIMRNMTWADVDPDLKAFLQAHPEADQSIGLLAGHNSPD